MTGILGRRAVARLLVGLAVIVAVVGACAGGGVGSTDGPGLPTATGPATAPSAAATPADGSSPPDATLSAEGGDAVRGQLGSYTWSETGSDSPWLPGASVAVGVGERLTVGLVPTGATASWRARYVPATQDSAAGAVSLGEGPGAPEFTTPPAGTWTVEVQVEFPAGIGSASYYWRLEVR